MTASIWKPGDDTDLTQVNADNTNKSERIANIVAGQTLCALTTFAYAPGTGSLEVRINGIVQFPGVDFTETDASHFTLTEPLEAGDVVDVRGVIGTSGAQSASASAAQAAASVIAANASYQNIQGLALPNLPLTFANGGLGANYANAAAAFNALSPLSAKGDLLTYGPSNARLAAGVDGYFLTTDSTQATGLKWTQLATIVYTNTLTAAGNMLLNKLVNYNYIAVNNIAVTLDATTGVVGNIVKFMNLGGYNYTVATAGGVQVNFANNTEIQLTNTTLPQGGWLSNVTFGKQISGASGDTLLGSVQLDANNIVFITATSGTTNWFATNFNLTTKTFGASLALVTVPNVTINPANLANFVISVFKVDATSFVLAAGYSGYNPHIAAYGLSGTAVILKSNSNSNLNSTAGLYAGTIPTLFIQITANLYLGAVSTGANGYSLQLFSWNGATWTIGGAYVNSSGSGLVNVHINTAYPCFTVILTNGTNVLAATFSWAGVGITAVTAATNVTAITSITGAYSIAIPGTTGAALVFVTGGGNTNIAVTVTNNTGALTVGVPVGGSGAPPAWNGKNYRSLVNQLELFYGFAIGNNLFIIVGNNLQGFSVAGTTVTTASTIPLSAGSRLFYSPVTGNYYISDSTANNIYKLTFAGAVVTKTVSHANMFVNTNSTMIGEQLINGNYYSNNAGVYSLLEQYPLINTTAPDQLLTADGKIMSIGSFVISNYI